MAWQNPLLRRAGAVLSILMVAGFAALSLWHGVRIALSDFDTLAVRWSIREWSEKRNAVPSPEIWEQAQGSLQGALQITPDNPQILEDLGYLHASRAQAMGWPKMDSPDEAVRQNLLTQAIDEYRGATLLRPTFPQPWAYMALAKHLKGTQDAEFWVAFDKALLFGNFAEGVPPVLAKLAFAQWTKLSPQRLELVTVMINSSRGPTRQTLLGMIQKAGVVVPRM
jgi:hypothetical protein